MRTEYLTDGVYVTFDAANELYPVVITTGHHDPQIADNVVYLEPESVKYLLILLKEEGYKQ